MYPYGYYQVPQVQLDYNPYVQTNQYNTVRQPSNFQELKLRLDQLEVENDKLKRRLKRINQRLRAVEQKFSLPYTPFDGEY